MYMNEEDYEGFIDQISDAIDQGYIQEEEMFDNDLATDAVLEVLIRYGIIHKISAN